MLPNGIPDFGTCVQKAQRQIHKENDVSTP